MPRTLAVQVVGHLILTLKFNLGSHALIHSKITVCVIRLFYKHNKVAMSGSTAAADQTGAVDQASAITPLNHTAPTKVLSAPSK